MATTDEYSEYVCTLNEASLEVARRELNEDPKERLSQVETFRTWILSQKHLKCPTDTLYLLKFLRTAKFSQLRARKILEGHLKVKTQNPTWLNDIDLTDPKIQSVVESGFFVPLPKRDPKGRLMLLSDIGKMNGEEKKWEQTDIIRAMYGMVFYCHMNEDDLVNGITTFEDMTHLSVKTLTYWSTDAMKKSTKLWQGNFPGRFKEFHYYNVGPVFETMMTMFRPFIPKKWLERMVLHGKNMEEVYKYIPKEYLPDEYLPDDYTGPSQGPLKKIIEDFQAQLKTPAVRNRILYETDSKWKYDFSLKPDADTPSESFRKLTVD